MGVDTHFQGNKMTLVKQSDFKPENLNLDLTQTSPNHSGDLLIRNWLSSYGPSYPKIKETDRLEALRIKTGSNYIGYQ
jgi:3-phosphoshikimate 1-carboxyvinyltransferase